MGEEDRPRYPHGSAFQSLLKANLKAFAPRREAGEGLKRAAVILLVAGEEASETRGTGPGMGGGSEAGFLLTRRSAQLSSHGGQWALPGGRVDPGESDEDAALRELQEELGLSLGAEALIGRLDDYPTRSGYCIAPFVAWLPQGHLVRPNPAEVAEVHHIAFRDLERPDSPEFLAGPDEARPILRIRFGGFTLHAPTGAVVHQAHEVAVHGRKTRVAHFDQPEFAWR